MIGGTTGGHVETKPKEKLKDKEYFDAYQKGEVDPFKEDGFV